MKKYKISKELKPYIRKILTRCFYRCELRDKTKISLPRVELFANRRYGSGTE